MSQGQYFRAGIGAIIRNSEGYILALERTDVPGAWQLPQGGLETGEEPIGALFREISEEVGIRPDQLKLVARAPEILAYELPLEFRRAKTGRGQVQYWFLLDYLETLPVELPVHGEFRRFRWTTINELLSEVVEFRRPIYQRLAEYPSWT